MLDTPIRKSFAYPKEFVTLPEYSAHANQVIMVLRPCAPEEADILYDDLDDGRGAIIVDRMFKVQADDGWIGDACETELEDISSDKVTTNN